MAEGEHRQQLVNLIRDNIGIPKYGAEIGVHKGHTSALLLKSFWNLRLALVDRWDDPAAYAKAFANTLAYPGRVGVFATDSCDPTTLAAIPDGALDFVFIDGDHSEEGCYRDMVAWYPKLRKGGVFCGHDFGKHDLPGVTAAVMAWMGKRDMDLSVTDKGHIWWTLAT